MHSFFPLQKFITDNYASFYQENWSKTWRKETQGSWQRILSYSLNKHLALSKEQPLFRAGLVLSKEYRTDVGDCRKTSHVIFLGSLGSGPITQQEDWNFMAGQSSMSHANMTKTQYKFYKQYLLWCVCVLPPTTVQGLQNSASWLALERMMQVPLLLPSALCPVGFFLWLTSINYFLQCLEL